MKQETIVGKYDSLGQPIDKEYKRMGTWKIQNSGDEVKPAHIYRASNMCRLMCYLTGLYRQEGDQIGDFSSQNRCCELSYDTSVQNPPFFECSMVWTTSLKFGLRDWNGFSPP